MGFNIWYKEYIAPDPRERLTQWTHKYTCGVLSVYISKRYSKVAGTWWRHWIEVTMPNGNTCVDYNAKYDFNKEEHIDEIKRHYGIDV